MPTDDLLQRVADQLERPVDTLLELDRRPFRLLFLGGSYLTLTLRDRVSRQILEPTVELSSGTLVDAQLLRSRDRAAAESWTTLTPRLRKLLLRHADLPALPVLVTHFGGETERASGDSAYVLHRAAEPDVHQVDLAGDVEILD